MLTSEKITATNVTPIDEYQFIQIIPVPQDENGTVLVVQKVKRNTSNLKDQSKAEMSEKIRAVQPDFKYKLCQPPKDKAEKAKRKECAHCK